jgi:hypothetical protein
MNGPGDSLGQRACQEANQTARFDRGQMERLNAAVITPEA